MPWRRHGLGQRWPRRSVAGLRRPRRLRRGDNTGERGRAPARRAGPGGRGILPSHPATDLPSSVPRSMASSTSSMDGLWPWQGNIAIHLPGPLCAGGADLDLPGGAESTTSR
uniref:Uncharacterized protein n=1 Tax=Triticum urartu TaxID=4572 RepID=A0A8R7K3E4_TRIUA